MARIAPGRGIRAIPLLTSGLSDRVYVANGEAREVDGCYFQVIGRVEKVKGVRNLVDWEWLTPHLLNTIIDAVTSYTVPGGPTELVVSLSGDSSEAGPHYPDLLNAVGSLGDDKYKTGRILVVRGDSLEKAGLPHIGEGSSWDENYSTSEEGEQIIAARRVVGTDQFEGDYFTTWGGYLFISNGLDSNLKWNGDYAARVGVHEVPAPPSASKVCPDPDDQLALDPDFSINDEFVGIGEGDRGNDLRSVQTMQYRATFVSESGAEGSRRARTVRHVPNAQLSLIAVKGDPTHFRFAPVADGWIELHLRILQFEGLSHGLQRLASVHGVNHAAHLHFAGGDQPQVDALLRQTCEQSGGNARASHHPRAADAQLGHAPFG